ncbi:MAG: ATP-binding protein [Candidatus Micrarchaeia archaeon]|jgi:hypothetical protein
MKSIRFGKIVATGKPATLDIETLISTRLLIQANSGGGKSYLLRKLIEETFGKVPIFVLDLEGEFHTLREKMDFFLIGSTEHGADLQISLKIASILPRRLLELGASAIIDMSELKHHERILFVKRFCEAMIALPKELWQPAIVILDEIHQFAPQKEKCESTGAVIDLATRGRKRGFCLEGASQRISKLSKDVAAELNNKLIGRCVLDVDMKRAAEEVGFTAKEDVRSLRELHPGEFYAFGPAMQHGVNKILVSAVKTTHPKIGSRILTRETLRPEKIRKMLEKLSDMQEEAEVKEKSEADLRKDNASLRGQLLAAQQALLKEQAKPKTLPKEQAKSPAKAAFTPILPDISKEMLAIEIELQGIKAKMKMKRGRAVLAPSKPASVQMDSKRQPSQGRGSIQIDPTQQPAELLPYRPRAGARRILETVASYHPKSITRQQVGTLVGMVPTGGTFCTYLSELQRAGWLELKNGLLAITPEGMTEAGDFQPISRKPEELLNLWAGKFRSGAAKMLREIAERYPKSITKEELGEALNMQMTGGTFNTYLSELRRAGLIELNDDGIVATKELFPE